MGGAGSGWRPDVVVVVCEACDWRFAVSSGAVPRECPHCLETRLATASTEDWGHLEHTPERIVESAMSDDEMTQALKAFASYRFKSSDLTVKKLRARMRLTYVPMWLVDADATAEWRAEVGYAYEIVSHEEDFSGERWHSHEVTETRARWEPRAGRLARRYHNAAAPALESHDELWETMGAWDPRGSRAAESVDYAAAAVALPTRSKEGAWPDALPTLQLRAAEECRTAAGADHVRQFAWSAEYSGREWSLLLLPMLTTYYRDDRGRRLVVSINGQSGLLTGRRRPSMRRAMLWTLPVATIALLAMLVSLAVIQAWGFGFGLLVLGAAVLLSLVAVLPAVDVWANRDGTEYRSRP